MTFPCDMVDMEMMDMDMVDMDMVNMDMMDRDMVEMDMVNMDMVDMYVVDMDMVDMDMQNTIPCVFDQSSLLADLSRTLGLVCIVLFVSFALNTALKRWSR